MDRTYDYERRAWLELREGVWVVAECAHMEELRPGCCYAGEHAGEVVEAPEYIN